MSLNDNEFNGAEKKITGYFDLLKKTGPEISDKAAAIDRLIEISGQNSNAVSLRAAAAFFIASLLFALFSAYLAFGAIADSRLEPAAAVYIGISPAVETVSRTISAGEQAAAVLISLSVFCIIAVALMLILCFGGIYLFNRLFSRDIQNFKIRLM
jgi:uncharacterized membrane protein YiaA